MTKEKKVVIDENGKVQFDFSEALDVFEPHELANMYSEYLSDADFVIEDENQLICMEYKNAKVEGAAHPEVFQKKLKEEKFWKKIAKKYYGTLFLVWACGRNLEDKPIKYILLMETSPGLDEVLKRKLALKLHSQLPFKYNECDEIKRSVLNEFRIMNLEQWDNEYPQYPVNYLN